MVALPCAVSTVATPVTTKLYMYTREKAERSQRAFRLATQSADVDNRSFAAAVRHSFTRRRAFLLSRAFRDKT